MKLWVELLFTYGPFALIVFLVYVCEGRARKVMNEAPPPKPWVASSIYIAIWVAIFALGWVTTKVWIKHASKDDLEIKGTLGNFVQELDGDVTLHSRGNKLYILKEYVGRSGHYSYSWRAILDNRLQQSIDLDFTLQRVCPPPRLDAGTNAGCESSVAYYRLSLDQGYFNSKIEIRQEQDRKAFKYYIDKKEGGVLKAEYGIGSPKLISAVSGPVSLFSPAFAQSLAPTPDSIARRFHSTDPLIRRDAAREFAALGKVGTDWIKRGLFEGEAGNQSRLDALLVLNELPDVGRAGFDDKVLARVIMLAFETKGELKQEALKAVAKLKGGRFLAHTRVVSQKFARIGGALEGRYAIWVDQIKVPTPLHVVLFATSEKTKELDRFVVVRHSQLREYVPSGAWIDEQRIDHQFEYRVSVEKDREILVVGKAGAPTIGDRYADFVFLDMSRRSVVAR